MNKFQAMAQIMLLLNEDGLLRPGSHVHHPIQAIRADVMHANLPPIVVRNLTLDPWFAGRLNRNSERIPRRLRRG